MSIWMSQNWKQQYSQHIGRFVVVSCRATTTPLSQKVQSVPCVCTLFTYLSWADNLDIAHVNHVNNYSGTRESQEHVCDKRRVNDTQTQLSFPACGPLSRSMCGSFRVAPITIDSNVHVHAPNSCSNTCKISTLTHDKPQHLIMGKPIQHGPCTSISHIPGTNCYHLVHTILRSATHVLWRLFTLNRTRRG